MPSHNAEIAGHFLADSQDYLLRVRLTEDDFWGVKSRRLKWFIDIQLAYECALKAIIAESRSGQGDGARLLEEFEEYRHRIERLEADAFRVLQLSLRSFGSDLDALPVGLRYRVDCWDYIGSNGPQYYETAGSHAWLESLVNQTRSIGNFVQGRLETYSRAHTGEALWEAMINARSRKYGSR